VLALLSDDLCDLHHGPEAGGALFHVLPQLFQLRQDSLGRQASVFKVPMSLFSQLLAETLVLSSSKINSHICKKIYQIRQKEGKSFVTNKNIESLTKNPKSFLKKPKKNNKTQ
jgi:hypothetical protein